MAGVHPGWQVYTLDGRCTPWKVKLNKDPKHKLLHPGKLPPPKINISPEKKDHPKRTFHDSSHDFFRGHVGFQGSNILNPEFPGRRGSDDFPDFYWGDFCWFQALDVWWIKFQLKLGRIFC